MELKECIKLSKEIHKKYFNKYFAGQRFVEPIIYDRLKDCMLSLTFSQTRFELLLNSLIQIEEDEPFFSKYPERNKKNIKEMQLSLEQIINTIREILTIYIENIAD